MNRLPALFLLACGVHSFGCIDEASLSSDVEPLEDEQFAALQLPADFGLPAPSGQIATVVEADVKQLPGAVTPPVATKVIPVRVENITGTGCSRALTKVETGSVFADSIKLVFDEDFFRIVLPSSPSGVQVENSLNCVIELRVRGVKGVQAAVHQVNYRGSSNLPANSRGRINSRIMWRDDEFNSEEAEQEYVRKGPIEGPWIFDHQVDLKANSARSRCFTSDQEEDIAYIELTSMLENSHRSQAASFEVTHTFALALDTEPAGTEQPPVEYRVAAVPCTP